jgi:hypothetical protein
LGDSRKSKARTGTGFLRLKSLVALPTPLFKELMKKNIGTKDVSGK